MEIQRPKQLITAAVGPINIFVQGVRFKEAEKPALEEESEKSK